jgi:hypothetical protein
MKYVVRARSEYTYHDVIDNDELDIKSVSIPVFAGLEAQAQASDRVTRLMTRAANGADARSKPSEADMRSKPFGSNAKTLGTSPKEGGSTNKNSKLKSKPSSVSNTEEGPRRSGRKKQAGNSTAQPPDRQSRHGLGQSGSAPTIDTTHADDSSTSRAAAPDSSFELGDELEQMDESLLNVINSGWHGLDLAKLLANHYGEDTVFRKILETPKEFRNFEVENGLIYLKDADHRMLCVPNITYKGRNVRDRDFGGAFDPRSSRSEKDAGLSSGPLLVEGDG